VLDIASDDPFAAPAVAAFFHAASPSVAPPSLSYRLIRASHGRYEAHAPGRAIFGPAELGAAWSFLEWRATEDVLPPSPEGVCLHAAGLRLGHTAVLLVGEAGAGKSTLAAALMERGHQAWGDDLVRFAPDSGTFSAFPRSLKLDNKSMSHLYLVPMVCAAATTGTLLAPECWYVSPAAIRRGWQASPGRPAAVVILDERERTGRVWVKRTSEGAAALLVSERLLGAGASQGRSRLTVRILDALGDTTAYRVGGGNPAALAWALEGELAS